MNYNRGTIYLSGALQFSDKTIKDWRYDVSEKLKEMNYFPINIFDLDKQYKDKYGLVLYNFDDNLSEEEKIKFKNNFRKHYHETDCDLVKFKSNAVVAFWDEYSQKGAGTHSEIHTAFEKLIPVFLVTSVPVYKLSKWLVSETTKIFSTFEELFIYLDYLPYGILLPQKISNECLCFLCGNVYNRDDICYNLKIKNIYCKRCTNILLYENNEIKDRFYFFLNLIKTQMGK